MRKWWSQRWVRTAAGGVIGVSLLVLVGPFLVPVPPLPDVHPPEELADADSRFVEAGGLRLHYKTAGAAQDDMPLLLLHGFGASLFSWHKVMPALGERRLTVAFDRPAFGLTERPLPGEWGKGQNPYTLQAQAAQAVALLDALNISRAVWVGHSAGGTVALLAALTYPERVGALVLVAPAVYADGGFPAWLSPLLHTPQARHLGPLLARSLQKRGPQIIEMAWHDPAQITVEDLAGYTRPLQAENWDRALWELTLARQPVRLPDRLDQIAVPVLVITGDDDRIVPTGQSVRLAQALPQAQLIMASSCGHLPHEEKPDEFLAAVFEWLAR